jgi:hypothetical protein
MLTIASRSVMSFVRFLLAFLLAAHGIAHVPGFLVSWQLASFPDLAYRTTIFGTSVNVGPEGIRLIGLCWLGMAVAFVAVATAIALNAPVRPVAIATTLALSLLLCAAGWPEARLGLVANAVIVLLLVWARPGVIVW